GKRNYVSLITETRTHILPNGMNQLEVVLPSEFFCRIHKSYIVALDKIKSFDEERLLLCEPAKSRSDAVKPVCLRELPLSKVFVTRLRKSILIIPARQGISKNSLLQEVDGSTLVLEG
ncbi:MAG TPA: LytTR family DNA-binding domain-containing protein, partial [Candidatus Brocadiaceae bacterium]